jgi:tRNA pseudouridine32 synthase/23S rRNA pseudouridine746 synthase
MDLEVLYADEALVVLNKPAGLLSVPGRGEDKQDCLSRRVQALYADALVVHRLDMATSGVLVMARGLPVQRLLNAAFSQRQVRKRYVAVVSGLIPLDAGPEDGWNTIDLPIVVDWPNRPLRIIDAARGQPSLTRLRCVAQDLAQQTSRLELEPVTGRSHQLRVHLQAVGHPILGDALYAAEVVQRQAPRLLLHASSLAFQHPLDERLLYFDCPAEF